MIIEIAVYATYIRHSHRNAVAAATSRISWSSSSSLFCYTSAMDPAVLPGPSWCLSFHFLRVRVDLFVPSSNDGTDHASSQGTSIHIRTNVLLTPPYWLARRRLRDKHPWWHSISTVFIRSPLKPRWCIHCPHHPPFLFLVTARICHLFASTKSCLQISSRPWRSYSWMTMVPVRRLRIWLIGIWASST